jgi:hypothetical protein
MARMAGKPKNIDVPVGTKADTSRKSPLIADVAQRLGRMIPDEELRLIPDDLSEQVDHFLYGSPIRFIGSPSFFQTIPGRWLPVSPIARALYSSLRKKC